LKSLSKLCYNLDDKRQALNKNLPNLQPLGRFFIVEFTSFILTPLFFITLCTLLYRVSLYEFDYV